MLKQLIPKIILKQLIPNHCFKESSYKTNYKNMLVNLSYYPQTWFGVGQRKNYSVFLSRLLGLPPHLSDNKISVLSSSTQISNSFEMLNVSSYNLISEKLTYVNIMKSSVGKYLGSSPACSVGFKSQHKFMIG